MNRRDFHSRPTSSQNLALCFEPDVLARYKYTDSVHPNLYLQPEKLLMLAVLEDAIDSFQRFHVAKDPRAKNISRDAEDWFLADQQDWLFSFTNVCDVLGLDPDYLRRGLLLWKARHQPAAPTRHRRLSFGRKARHHAHETNSHELQN